MATVDSLDIQISAQVNKANASLTTLINRLDRVSASLAGVNSRGLATMGAGINKLANAMSNFSANTKTADFSRLSRNLASISNIDTSKFSDISSKMSQLSSAFNGFGAVPESAQKIGEFANSISKFGNKSAQNAITNIPLLANSIKNLIQTLSTAPKVNTNIINMTSALAQLASQGSKVGAASNSISENLKRYSINTNKASKSTKNLSESFRNFYITAKMAINIIKKIGSQLTSFVKSSMDYVETLNYFNAAFGQVASNADLKSFKEMGYESAEEYYNSFSKRAEQLTRKMTGFKVSESGMLINTNQKSLGINPEQLMNYQAMFGQMSSSMGVVSENALLMSDVLTKIGADLASVRNMDFDKVWTDMASGLAGMSRTLDKYGANIRNVNLQQKLNEIGIQANISSLNQNDKALLRTIILLDSTRYAWGDMANTIQQPANQLRLIKQNFSNLARTIGNIFLPIVSKVLPYINAMVIALQRLAEKIVLLLGFEDFNWGGLGGGKDNDALSNIYDDVDNISDSFGEATKKAKEFQNQLLGFDEVYKLTEPTEDTDASDVGLSIADTNALNEAFKDITSEYQSVWNKAFEDMENSTQKLADKIEKKLKPVKNIFKDFYVGDFIQAGKDTTKLVTGITDFFSDAISKVDWYGIGQKIGDFLSGIGWTDILSSIGKLIWEAINASIELWKGSFSKAPFETAFLTILSLPAIVGFGSKIIGLIVNPFKNVFALLKPIISGIGSLFAEGGIFGTSGIIASASAPVIALTAAFASLVVGLGYVFVKNKEVRKSFMQAASALKKGLKPAIEFVTNTLLPDLNKGWEKLKKILTPFGEFLNRTFVSIWQDMINPALTYIGNNVLPKVTESFEKLWGNVLVPLGNFLADVFEPAIKLVSDVLNVLWKDIIVPLANVVGNTLGKAFEGLCDVFNIVIEGIGLVVKEFRDAATGIKNAFQGIGSWFSGIWNGIKNVFQGVGSWFGTKFRDAATGIKNAFQGIGSWFSGIWNGIKNVFQGVGSWFGTKFRDAATGIKNAFQGIGSWFSGIWNGIKNVFLKSPGWFMDIFSSCVGKITKCFSPLQLWFKTLFQGVKDVIKAPLNLVIGFVNGIIKGVEKAINFAISGLNKLSFKVPKWVPGIGGEKWGFDISPVEFGKVPHLAKGGIATQYTTAVIGEAGMEAVLPLTNKRTMGMIAESIFENSNYNSYDVRNGEDYIKQIEEATYRGTMRAIQEAGGIKAEATFKVSGDPKKIFNIVREESYNYAISNNSSPFLI